MTESLVDLVQRVQRGDRQAFEAIVRRFQDMAVGYGYAVLGDLDLAEDAAQEAFINAYRDLPALRDGAAFPGWFRQIVFKHIDRARRRRRGTIPLEQAQALPARAPGPVEAAERRMVQRQITAAINSLPERQRAVVTLFYIHSYSQEEIGSFLEIPVATVKTRLHSARKLLKERMINVIQDNLPDQRPSRDDAFTRKVMNLFQATLGDDIAQVKALLQDDPRLANSSGELKTALWNATTPALHVAVMYGRKDIIDLLLEHGADINEKDRRFGFSALHQAIDLEFLPDDPALGMVDFLISRGAKMDIFGYVWQDDVEHVRQMLAEYPAQVNAIGPNHGTPICHSSSPEMTRLLLDRGADVRVRMSGEWWETTPIRWVAQHNRRDPEKLRAMLEKTGVEMDIFLACVFGDAQRVLDRLAADPGLLHAFTGPEHGLEPGLMPLHLAAQFGHLELTRLLLERGAQVNARSPLSYNLTPLHAVVWQGQMEMNPPRPLDQQEGYSVFRLLPEIPRLLLEHGADRSARDSLRSLTPLEWAQANLEDETDRSEVAGLLIDFI